MALQRRRHPVESAYKYDYFNNGDDWLISPAITPSETGTLIVKYTFSGSMYGESMEVYSGKGGTVEDMTSKEATYDNIKKDEQSGYFLVDAKPASFPHSVPRHIYGLQGLSLSLFGYG